MALNKISSEMVENRETGKSVKEDIGQVKTRVDNLVAHAGDTDGNAELLDIRVGYDGTVYDTAGEAVRAISSFMVREGQPWGVD